jgi:hypothetical protein
MRLRGNRRIPDATSDLTESERVGPLNRTCTVSDILGLGVSSRTKQHMR